MLTISSGTVSSRPRDWKAQIGDVAEMSSVRKTPFPDVTQTLLGWDGSISSDPAQWMALPEIHAFPLGSMVLLVAVMVALVLVGVQFAPPSVETKIRSP